MGIKENESGKCNSLIKNKLHSNGNIFIKHSEDSSGFDRRGKHLATVESSVDKLVKSFSHTKGIHIV